MSERPAPFTGVGVALVTLFNADGSVDGPATAELAERLVGAGVDAVVVAGTTGEAQALAPGERAALLDAVGAAIRPHGAVLVAGTGAPSAPQAARLTADAAQHGADAALALSPPWAADPRPYYDEVAKAAGELPLLAYHFPAASPPGIPVDLLPELPVAGCKDTSGDADRLLETLTRWDGHLYVGTSALVGLAGQLRLAGTILALANAEPELCIRAFAGDGSAQRQLAGPHTAMLAGGFPAGIKQLTAARWGTSPVTRMG
jgi:dihydrodipicolinate synthase/N-acetylneuraminate lyase